MLKKKKHFLVRFDKKEEAITIRKIAEEEIFGDFLKWYDNNKQSWNDWFIDCETEDGEVKYYGCIEKRRYLYNRRYL